MKPKRMESSIARSLLPLLYNAHLLLCSCSSTFHPMQCMQTYVILGIIYNCFMENLRIFRGQVYVQYYISKHRMCPGRVQSTGVQQT